MDGQLRLREDQALVEERLAACFRDREPMADLYDAMEYSLLGGGKRIRPVLTLETCRMCGGSPEQALPFACAVEMVHSYSLVHDDLPCMDNDDMRRGKPSCHKAFSEEVALLSGDGLLSLAFETMAKADPNRVAWADMVKATRQLAADSGAMGMVGGQVIDLNQEGKDTSYELLQEMHRGKTGRMIICAAKLGCYAAGASEDKLDAAEEYAGLIGRVFQMVDDLLDVVSDEATLGKPIGSDAQNKKTTYYTLFGVDKTMQMAEQLTQQAKDIVTRTFGSEGRLLCDLADLLLHRNH